MSDAVKPAHTMMIGLGYVLIQRQRIEQISLIQTTDATVGRGRIKMFRLNQSTPEAGDCTCGYKVLLDKEYTVQEFVDTVLTEKNKEWGYIGIYDPSDFIGRTSGSLCIEYRYGEIKSEKFRNDILSQIILSVSASGGWSRMDYVLHI